MFVVELFDVQEESFDSQELLPLSSLKNCIRFLHLNKIIQPRAYRAYTKSVVDYILLFVF